MPHRHFLLEEEGQQKLSQRTRQRAEKLKRDGLGQLIVEDDKEDTDDIEGQLPQKDKNVKDTHGGINSGAGSGSSSGPVATMEYCSTGGNSSSFLAAALSGEPTAVGPDGFPLRPDLPEPLVVNDEDGLPAVKLYFLG